MHALTHVKVHKLLTWQSSSPISVTPPYSPLYDDLPSPDIPYHSTLGPYQAPTTFHLHRTREWTGEVEEISRRVWVGLELGAGEDVWWR